MVYGETGRHPLLIEASISSVRYWLKLNKMDSHRFPKQALDMLKSHPVMSFPSVSDDWLKNIKDLLYKHGFKSVYINGGTKSEKAFLAILRRKMIDEFKSNWQTKLTGSDRFATYTSFKQNLHLENYINEIGIKKFRDPFIWMRLGINDLGINKRYGQTSDLTSKCKFCPNKIEDEVHFIFDCPLYYDVREKYINPLFS